MTFFLGDIADAVEVGLRREAKRLDTEQAVFGLDVRDEVDLHPLLATALIDAGYGVAREQRYPADRRKRKESEGERCDLVLTPDGRPLQVSEKKATLFDDPDALPLDEGFWLEVKTVAQFTDEGANRNYSSQLLSTVRHDVTKLSKDDGILHAGLLLILFVRDREIAVHDLKVWQDTCLEKGLPIGAPARRDVAVTDRHGHACAAVAVYPVSHW